jgi:hypothetical protein
MASSFESSRNESRRQKEPRKAPRKDAGESAPRPPESGFGGGADPRAVPRPEGRDGGRAPAPTPCADANRHDCRIDIRIESQGDVNIYNCSQPERELPCPPPADDTLPCPTAPGACVPLALGAKPKQSRRRKIERLLAHNRVPSALAAGFFQTARRFNAGVPAGNALEAALFARLSKLSPELRGVLRCTLDSFDSLSGADSDRLVDTRLTSDPAVAVSEASLAAALSDELTQRVGLLVYGDPQGPVAERPGLIRVIDPGGAEIFESPVNVCRINGLRTATFKPTLSLGDYEPAELQQHCVPVQQNGQVVQNCALQNPPCPGNQFDSACMRVPEVEAGSAVLLEGVNFFSTDAKVLLTAKAPATGTRLVDAHVVGDIETPLSEIVDGQSVMIRDCRVHDRLTFRVPDDLAPATYELQVVVPNLTGIPFFDPEIRSFSQFITVVPPSTARFQIASEQLFAREETSPASFGSDEVGIRVVALPLLPDGSTGDPQTQNIRFGDVDTGETRTMNRVLFSHLVPIAGVALTIVGYEIDSEDAFEKQIDDWSEVFIDVVKAQWEKVKGLIEAAGGFSALKGLGLKVYIAMAIAAAVALAIDFFYSLWAPADLIIDDAIGLSTVDLAALTSLNFPIPEIAEQTTEREIRVVTKLQSKQALTYFETREYISDDEDSRYEIRLRYNRVV